MCDTCGCGQPGNQVRIIKPGEDTHEHYHPETGITHSHALDHEHDHVHETSRRIELEEDILGKNKLIAERNRGYFEARGIFALNLVSSPGSGKTSLLERSIRELKGSFSICVIEGDQQTMNDAGRIQETGAPVVQVNTGQGCHLDAGMINAAVKKLEVPQDAVLMIENVGNLICPALFDLGESKRVVIMSVTEGEDKPLKYPYMFLSSDLCVMNKTDLLPYLDFDMGTAHDYALQVNPQLEIIELSVKTGEGMQQWYDWIINQRSGI
jgi:hydrogenase nickel incorporation protein HypB